MKTYNIDELYAYAWESAIENTRNALRKMFGTTNVNWQTVEELASKLNIRFDENGNIVK